MGWASTVAVASLMMLAGCADNKQPCPEKEEPAASGGYGGGGTGGTGSGGPGKLPLRCSVEIQDVPSVVLANHSFSFVLEPWCNQAFVTDHLGAHSRMHHDWATVTYPGTCPHIQAGGNSAYQATCAVDRPGVHYLRGHLKVVDGNKTVVAWSSWEYVVVALADNATPPEIWLADVPAGVWEDTAFNVKLVSRVPVDTPHKPAGSGVHWAVVPGKPEHASYPGDCTHPQPTLPGTQLISCSVGEPGHWVLRGHAAWVEPGRNVQERWTSDVPVTVWCGLAVREVKAGSGNETATEGCQPQGPWQGYQPTPPEPKFDREPCPGEIVE